MGDLEVDLEGEMDGDSKGDSEGPLNRTWKGTWTCYQAQIMSGPEQSSPGLGQVKAQI